MNKSMKIDLQTITNNLRIRNVEIQDLNENDYEPTKGCIQVAVECELFGEHWVACFQTSSTYDAGGVSSNLGLNQNEDELLCDILKGELGEQDHDEDGFMELTQLVIEYVKDTSEAQKEWDDYVNENYKENPDYPARGIDANSETNELTRK